MSNGTLKTAGRAAIYARQRGINVGAMSVPDDTKMTVSELIAAARAMGLKVTTKMKKSDLVATINSSVGCVDVSRLTARQRRRIRKKEQGR